MQTQHQKPTALVSTVLFFFSSLIVLAFLGRFGFVDAETAARFFGMTQAVSLALFLWFAYRGKTARCEP